MKKTSTAIVALSLAIAIALPGSAEAAKKRKKAPAAPPCVAESMMQAVNVYTLKTELMTAALSCGQEARQKYNQFVGYRKLELIQYGGQLRKGLGKKTNNFVTELANKTGGQLNCQEADGHFEKALAPDMPLLETIATTEWAQPRHGYQVCASKARKTK